MSCNKFIKFLSELGFCEKDINQNLKEDTFFYYKSVKNEDKKYENDIHIRYIHIPEKNFKEIFFQKHADIWNENNECFFIVISDYDTYLINAKVKPDFSNPLHKYNTIENFRYGINSTGFAPNELRILSKDNIDSAYFFDFIIEKIKRQKTGEVDKDLLLNLIQLKNDLLQIHNAQETVHLLILRCLFIKYLEDREIYKKNYLLNILKTGSGQKLIDAFDQIKRINGDIFQYDEFSVNDIHSEYLEKLEKFFSCDYRSGQGTLFPYRFNKIPIQLISHVYEAFLCDIRKKSKGIYYTPEFIVRFMLSHTVLPKLQEKKDITVLDPSCGSGAFLVEAFRQIVNSYNAEHDYDKKKDILENQIFGIDIDRQALQIATFSLYLALLEGEEPKTVQEKIENAYPILPSLINHTLRMGNSLTDDIYSDINFDCIVGNPPWGSVPKTGGDKEDKRERSAIGEKGKIGSFTEKGITIKFSEYENVADYQRSQAFLLRIDRWCNANTICSLIVNSPIFLNEKAEDFRKDLLNRYRIINFYELSHLNKILFKKRSIGKIRNNGKEEDITIGSSEPCAIIVFDKKDIHDNIIRYISPKLTKFSETFQLIHYTQKDIISIKQEDLKKEDYWLWRIFVNGTWSDYQLIKKAYINRDEKMNITCRSGFQPKNSMETLGNPLYRNLIEPENFEQYVIKGELEKFNWNQKLHRRRKEDTFVGKRILIPVKPLESDKLRFRGIRVDKDIVHKHNILCIKINKNNKLIEDYALYLGILNSSFLGYYIYHISSQWGKGEEKRSALRNSDIEKLPFPYIAFSDERIRRLINWVEQIEADKKEGKDTSDLEYEIDELVFDLYKLSEFLKETVREFYQINVERYQDMVKPDDIQKYVDKFRKVFSFILDEHLALNAMYRISSNIGAYVTFSIVKKEEMISEVKTDMTEERQILDIVKSKQLSNSDTLFSSRLNEDKVKIYDNENFFIIKSNYFKDWTIRQAINDANEEIALIMKGLPER